MVFALIFGLSSILKGQNLASAESILLALRLSIRILHVSLPDPLLSHCRRVIFAVRMATRHAKIGPKKRSFFRTLVVWFPEPTNLPGHGPEYWFYKTMSDFSLCR
jgi:hypothetical protein